MDRLKVEGVEDRIALLSSKGVIIHDPRQVFVAPDVVVENILPGVQLFPGTRISGSNSVIGKNAIIGSEGPATLENVVVDDGVEVASGFLTNAALLRGSRIGSNAHVRACTILEEEASIAHAVGLKQTIVMSYVTLGSLINFCDGIISGGRSRADHTEIGSGFINFNFTPWGARGDKATPTLIGNVYDGVFLTNDRIFMGGLSGIVGPGEVSFGACTVAGQIIREDVGPNMLFSSIGRKLQVPTTFQSNTFSERKYQHNVSFIGNLAALHAWYRQVRLARVPKTSELTYKTQILEFSVQLIERMIVERIARLQEYLRNFTRSFEVPQMASAPCPIKITPSATDHVEWVRSLEPSDTNLLQEWLRQVGNSVWRNLSP